MAAGLMGFFTYFALMLAQGVPNSYTWRNLIPLDITRGAFLVEVSPQVPTTLGQEVTVTVRDAGTGKPVDKASVSISKNGDKLIVLTTDNNGKVRFDYPGIATVIVVTKELYRSEMKVIPKVPDTWILAEERAWLASIAASVISGVILAFIVRKHDGEI